MAFDKIAVRSMVKVKLGITGPSGAGKTYSALRLARGLIGPEGKIGLIDTENKSASLYSHVTQFFAEDIAAPFTAEKFVKAIQEAEAAGIDVLIIDTFSHVWEGALAFKAQLDAAGGNSYTNWDKGGQKFNLVLNTIKQSEMHVICCMRSKMDYVQEKNENGKTVIRKVGLAPIMRSDTEFEFTTVFDIGQEHLAQCINTKDRTEIFKDRVFQITEADGQAIAKWLAGAKPDPKDAIIKGYIKRMAEAKTMDEIKAIAIELRKPEVASTLTDPDIALLRTKYDEACARVL